jgi:hypothetical protein
MADDQNYPANADVIPGARAIRSNPALFAALMSPPTAAPASPDPTAGFSTHNDPGGRFGEPPRSSPRKSPPRGDSPQHADFHFGSEQRDTLFFYDRLADRKAINSSNATGH